jgi:hypothetical protein
MDFNCYGSPGKCKVDPINVGNLLCLKGINFRSNQE